MATVGLVNKIKLPGNMVVGLILPLSLISLDSSEQEWPYAYPPLANLLEEVDWAKFFSQVDLRSTINNAREALTGQALLETLDKDDQDFEEILNILLDREGLNLTGIIVRIDVAKSELFYSELFEEDLFDLEWKDYYGYCQEFSELEGVLQSLIEKANQEDAV